MKFQIPFAEQAEIESLVHAAAGLGFSYLILLVLSSLIATFGLISNSTATVIGAMIVAPLMGPILGIALSLVQGDLAAFRRSLTAEVVGVLVVLGTAIALSKLLGQAQIDLSQSEIVARTHPTLLDLAIGFAAGLAGAFATVNRKISGSIAGVAIAVALVPPLCVSGLCLGAGHSQSGLGAFVLFLANFLTIQLAAVIVFSLAGLGHWENLRRERQLLRAFILNLLLLTGTGIFLARQLANLVKERGAEQLTRGVITRELSQLAGASIDSLNVRLVRQNLEVELRARAPEEVGVSVARKLQKQLQQRVGYPVQLRISTARASYVTPEGHLFLPEKTEPSQQQLLEADVQRALTTALQSFPGVELTSMRMLEEPGNRWFILLRSPYLFDARLVSRLKTLTMGELATRRPDLHELSFTVRTTLVQDYTESGLQNIPIDLPLTAEEEKRQELERRAALVVAAQPGADPLEIHVTSDSAEEQKAVLNIDLKVRSAQPLTAARVKAWRSALAKEFQQPILLSVQVDLGQWFRLEDTTKEASRTEGSKRLK